MGVFLDTSVPIKAQRLGLDETAMLSRIRGMVGNDDLASSTIVVTELLVGVSRAREDAVRRRRQLFVDDFLRDVPIHAYLLGTAELAGRIGGEQGALGLNIPFVDLMIGVTALTLGFSILTTNERHFRLIPGLNLMAF